MHRFAFTALAATFATGCIVHIEEHTDQDQLVFDEAVSEVLFDLHAGDVVVRVADVEEVRIDRYWTWRGDVPSVQADLVGGRLELTVDCHGGPLERCSVDHEILLPADAWVHGFVGAGDLEVSGLLEADVDVETGAGDILLVGIGGDADALTGAGDVELDDIVGNLGVETGAGDVFARDLRSPNVFVHSGAGDLDLELAAVPSVVHADTGTGDILLEVPTGTYDIHARTGTGAVDVTGVTTSSEAASSLDLETGAGDITVFGT